MKSIRSLFFLLLVVLVYSGCSDGTDTESGVLDVNFKAVYDGQPLVTFTTHPFANGQNIEFSHLSFFVTDLQLSSSAKSYIDETPDLLDLSFDNLNDATEGATLSLAGVQPGVYNMLRFGFGIPSDINSSKPEDFPSNNPLSKSGYYWQAWQSYIFSKTEGRLDTLGNGALDLGFAFHTGSNELYRILEVPVPITIEDGKATSVDVLVDYKKLLEGIDIKSNPLNHNPTDSVQIQKIVNNLVNAITLVQ